MSIAAPPLEAPEGDLTSPRHLLVAALRMMADPTAVLRQRLEQVAWPWALSISGTAFTLFFLQTGLDLARADEASSGEIALLATEGAAIGTLGVMAIGWLGWVLSRAFGGVRPTSWVVRAFALGYAPTLVYALFGIVANVTLGWNTAVAFGVTGVLWALGPMTIAIKQTMGERLVAAAAIVTICGGALLFAWAALGTGSL